MTASPRPRRALRRRSLESWTLLGSAGLLLAGTVLPAPFVIEAPGPTFNTVGQHDGRQLLGISGAPTYPSESVLDLTTVYVTGGPSKNINALTVLGSWLDPSAAVVPVDTLYPRDASAQDVTDASMSAMSASQDSSVAAALEHLGVGFGTELTVQGTVPDGPADGARRARPMASRPAVPATRPSGHTTRIRSTPEASERWRAVSSGSSTVATTTRSIGQAT